MLNLNQRAVVILVLFEFPFDDIFTADQYDLQTQGTSSEDRSADLRLGAVIAAHRINCDRQHRMDVTLQVCAGLFFRDFNDFAALVLTALGAGSMR